MTIFQSIQVDFGTFLEQDSNRIGFFPLGGRDSFSPPILVSMTLDDNTYNGWSNYETWLTNLWLTNDESTQAHCRSIAEAIFSQAQSCSTFTQVERYRLDFSEELKLLVEDGHPLQESPGLYSDLLNAAISEVDWMEIASNMFEDFGESTAQ